MDRYCFRMDAIREAEITRNTAGLVAEAIKTTGKTRAVIARATGIPNTTFGRKLQGHGSFTVEELARIASETSTQFLELLPPALTANSCLEGADLPVTRTPKPPSGTARGIITAADIDGAALAGSEASCAASEPATQMQQRIDAVANRLAELETRLGIHAEEQERKAS